MARDTAKRAKPPGGRERILQAALGLIRARGYAATSIEDLCAAAGVTKGAFFHHFASKEALGVAAAAYWAETTGAMFAAAPYHQASDPLARVLAYIEFRAALIDGPPEAFTCLAGTMVQEVFDSHPTIRDACNAAICGHAATLEADIAAAMDVHGIGGIAPASLALHTQTVLQGAFVLAKAGGGAEAAREAVRHLKRYVTLLFNTDNPGETPS